MDYEQKLIFEQWVNRIFLDLGIKGWSINWMDGCPSEGECDVIQKVIRIGTNGTLDQSRKLILHEIAHVIMWNDSWWHKEQWKKTYNSLEKKYLI